MAARVRSILALCIALLCAGGLAPSRAHAGGVQVLCCNDTTFACSLAIGFACPPGSTLAFGSCTANPNPCQPGACCSGGGCQILPTGLCNGRFVGPGSACTPGLCTLGACCDKGCFVTIASFCSEPLRGPTCQPDPCEQPPPCACTWVNGLFDDRDGQISHLGGAAPAGEKAADDFFLCDDFIYDLDRVSATILTTTFPGFVKPKAEIYADCDGCPGALLYTLDSPDVFETGNVHSIAADGRPLRIVEVTWFIDGSQQIVANRNIVLKGGRYWLSVYGQTDNLSLMNPPMHDVTYWGTTENGNIKGLPARKITGRPTPVYNQFRFDPGCGPTGWRSVAEGCCIGCTDLNFSVCTKPCKILIDNGPARNVAGVPLGSTSQFAIGLNSPLQTRSADDFVIPPCQSYTICYVEACILTNCPTFEGVFELYANNCRKPSYVLHGLPFGGVTYVATKIINLGFVWTVGTAIYRAFKLEFHDLAIVVPGGTQMWISAGVRYTFSLAEKAFFCYNDDPCRPCDIKWNPGRVLTVTSMDLDPPLPGQQPARGWAALTDDFSFLIAADGNTTPGPINSTPTCAADFNRDGVLNVTDIFDYLSGWFAGCP